MRCISDHVTLAVGQRAFHWIGAAILFTASTALLFNGIESGCCSCSSRVCSLQRRPIRECNSFHSIHFLTSLIRILQTDTSVNPYTRQVWYARYIDWTSTSSLCLLQHRAILMSTLAVCSHHATPIARASALKRHASWRHRLHGVYGCTFRQIPRSRHTSSVQHR